MNYILYFVPKAAPKREPQPICIVSASDKDEAFKTATSLTTPFPFFFGGAALWCAVAHYYLVPESSDVGS